MPFTPAMMAAATGNAMPASPAAAWLPLQQMQKAWTDLGNQMVGGASQAYTTALDRTFGALSDALGLGPDAQAADVGPGDHGRGDGAERGARRVRDAGAIGADRRTCSDC